MSGAAQNRPVAIIGMGCRFPGGVNDVESFRKLLMEGRDAVGEIPHDRIDVERFFDPRPATPGRMMTHWGGYLDNIKDFDAGFFGISPREAERLDPQQRLLLETVWEAIEDAGVDAAKLEGSRTGVFVGQWTSDFENRLFTDPEDVDFQMTTGSGRYAASGRISYFLGLRGPSLTVDTACSSSLAAIHLAVRSIQTGDATLAFAGGVNVILQPHVSIAYSQSLMMAPDGRCKFGDASGDGYVRSEGAGIVLLKPLDQALADGDRIHAVIRGGALNNDGRSSGSMGTPSRVGQEELLRTAYGAAGVAPASVGYVEAHGTGTRAGDPVELGAIGKVLGGGRAPGQQLLVGSVKTNIGHTEGAAGVAGLMKAALAVQAGVIPASLNLKTRNPDIDWERCSIAAVQTPWPETSGQRIAGVSAFGIAGANAHIVLEQPPATRATPNGKMRPASLLPLSARSQDALRTLADRYAALLSDGADVSAVAANAAIRRTSLDHRAAFVGADGQDLVKALRDFAAGGPASAEAVSTSSTPKVAFVFPGQGGQWIGMARQLMVEEPGFRETIERCDVATRAYADWSIVRQLEASPEDDDFILDRIDVIQPVLLAVSIAYAERLRAAGVVPDAVVGHSMGEVAAAYIAGVIDLDRAMEIICRRSALMRGAAGKGAMALVDLSAGDVQARLTGEGDRVGVAVTNSPRSCVISGEPDAVQDVIGKLSAEGVFCRLVKVDVASHSHQMEPLAQTLKSQLGVLNPAAGKIPVYSTVLGCRADGAEFDASYWGANLRRPVQFADAVARLLADGVSVFVECGPHPVLLPSIQQTAKAGGRDTVCTLATGDRDEPGYASVLKALGGLWTQGVAIDWSSINDQAPVVQLPLYPWQRERHWIDLADLTPGDIKKGKAHRKAGASTGKGSHAAARHRYVPGWADAPAAGSKASSQWLLLSDRQGVADALAKILTSAGMACRLGSLEDLAGLAAGSRVVDLRSLEPAGMTEGVHSLLQLVHATGAKSTCWAVTHHARAVEAGERAQLDVASSAMWGLSAALTTEHGDVWAGCVDIEPGLTAEQSARALFDHLQTGQRGDVALRGGRRLQPRLRAMQEGAAHAPISFRPDASYLVTGGLGGVGVAIARWMVAQGARRLVVFGRTPLPERSLWRAASAPAIDAVRGLEAMGASVVHVAIDVGDEGAVSGWLSDYAAQDWPPIRGVVHAAGVSDERLTREMDFAAIEAVMRGKAQGAVVLDRLLPDLDFFVMTSSTAALMPYPGQSVYAAANAAIDAVSIRRAGHGQHAVSIGWPTWIGLGIMSGEKGAARFRQLQLHGIGGIEADDAVALLPDLVGGAEPHVVVYPADWAIFKATHSGRDLSLFAELLPAAAEASPSLAAIADPVERRQRVEAGVREAISRVLKLPAARIEPRKPLGNLGLTSLLAMELRNRLEALVERPLSATLAFNYPTVEALVGFLSGEEAPVAAPPAKLAAAGVALEALADLSDLDAAQLLRRGR